MPNDDHEDLKSQSALRIKGDITPAQLAKLQAAHRTTPMIIIDADDAPGYQQLARMIARYNVVIAEWVRINGNGTHAGADKVDRALQCCITAIGAIREHRYADARQLVGIVQGILYTVGIHNWEYLASDDARE